MFKRGDIVALNPDYGNNYIIDQIVNESFALIVPPFVPDSDNAPFIVNQNRLQLIERKTYLEKMPDTTYRGSRSKSYDDDCCDVCLGIFNDNNEITYI